MARVLVRAYTSPTLVLLAFNWEDGAQHPDFLGFAIQRNPGFSKDGKPQFMFNKIDFDPPRKNKPSKTSDKAPIQKFHWWDSAIDTKDQGKQFEYTVTPVLGTGKDDLHVQTAAASEALKVRVPLFHENGVGTYFNRAVVSSQAFSRISTKPLTTQMKWLANGMEDAVSSFLRDADSYDAAIYHLTDKQWILPAMAQCANQSDLVYHVDTNDTASLKGATELKKRGANIHPRSKTNIMHDKFIVRTRNGKKDSVLLGSANFTPEAQTTQANVLHIFDSPELAALYDARQKLLRPDPAKKDTAQQSGWSHWIPFAGSDMRVLFSPEVAKDRVALDTIVNAVRDARSSVMFCLYSPTDVPMLEALLQAGDERKIMYGLLNRISDPSAKAKDKGDPDKATKSPSAVQKMQVEVFHRSREDMKVVDYQRFASGEQPEGFLPEAYTIDTSSFSTNPPPKPKKGKKSAGPPPVHIHHKFILIDGDTSTPVLFTGSANMSDNSTHNNDENLLHIVGNRQLSQAYLAEFMRLYEHYHARAEWDYKQEGKKGKPASPHAGFRLKTTRDGWVKGAYRAGTVEYAERVRLAQAVQAAHG